MASDHTGTFLTPPSSKLRIKTDWDRRFGERPYNAAVQRPLATSRVLHFGRERGNICMVLY